MDSRTAAPNEDTLPNGWAVTSVESLAANEFAALTDGPFGSNLKSDHYTDAGPRVIRLQNIGDGVFLDAEAHISKEHFESLRKHEACTDDVVVAMLGEQLPRACLVPAALGPAIVKADCVRLRVHPEVANPSYVMAGLNSQTLRRQAAELMHGVGRPRLGLQWLRGLRFPIAPLPEQRRIVEEIESYFTRLDDAVATLERVERNLKRYRASVLKAAVEGRLVPTEAALAKQEGRDYEPASVLLGRNLTERRRRWSESGKKGKYEEPTPADTTNLPDLPEGWCWASMDQLTDHLTSGSRDWSKYYDRGTCVFVMAQNVRPGRLEMRFKQYVDPPLNDASRTRTAVAEGDLLVTIVGANTGDVCRVPLTLNDHYVCQSIALMRPTLTATSEYLDLYLNSPNGRKVYEDFMYGQGRPHLGFEHLKGTPVPLPPDREIGRIVKSSLTAVSAVESLEQAAATNLKRVARLRQSILKWAFEGKLADQDSNDEPASVLLERIKAERAAPARPSPRSGRRPRALP